jgi:hypothetical protein
MEKITKKEDFRVGENYESHNDIAGCKVVREAKFLRWFKRKLDDQFYCEFQWTEPSGMKWCSLVREDELLECDFREILKPKYDNAEAG